MHSTAITSEINGQVKLTFSKSPQVRRSKGGFVFSPCQPPNIDLPISSTLNVKQFEQIIAERKSVDNGKKVPWKSPLLSLVISRINGNLPRGIDYN